VDDKNLHSGFYDSLLAGKVLIKMKQICENYHYLVKLLQLSREKNIIYEEKKKLIFTTTRVYENNNCSQTKDNEKLLGKKTKKINQKNFFLS
jgi:hypothetical protein